MYRGRFFLIVLFLSMPRILAGEGVSLPFGHQHPPYPVMKTDSSLPDLVPPSPPNRGQWSLALLLGFLLLAWGVWWYFDYKIQSLDASLPP